MSARVVIAPDALRLGVKGPAAAAWLQRHGVAIPELPNAWCLPCDDATDSDIVVRLGAAEFLLEQSREDTAMETLIRELGTPMAGVYPVLREDRSLVLEGALARAVLAQTCSMNFDDLPHPNAAVMTMMIGVAVIVVPQGNAAQRRYRIWCDPSYGDYLHESLSAVVRDVTGQPGE